MAKRSKANTNVDQVRQQNAASQMGNSDTEFASETDVQAVRQANQQSAAKVQQNNQQSNQNNQF
ncbi:gamma type small acid-soluble spore protein [Aneurinibacillus soli]|uniref:Small, acid-soluble spore protein gamma-type n=1 Tax=Aneurinibacillus soli TaxID=1500254 RepID=A0A0U5BAP3_9BACL|nr:gamma-type small acid-soluble spore protein [Aneurinibacillus soli]PYE60313.1 gamma type small acid-soluble spore protein [Aneurinibacillus soli]BAU27287.1 Small, acid-soluble spore protein gamma-type [Aneurinibacillus soli]